MVWPKRIPRMAFFKTKINSFLGIFLLCMMGFQAMLAQQVPYALEDHEDLIWVDSLEVEKVKRSPQPDHGDAASYSEGAFDKAQIEADDWKKLVGERDYTEEDSYQPDPEIEPIADDFSFDPTIWRWFLILLIAGVFIYLLTRLAHVNPSLNKKVDGLDLEELEQAEQNIQESDLERLLRKALAAQDYRSALRVRYLMVLKALDANAYIEHKAAKTNLNYIIEMKGRPEQKKFMELSHIFEYVWYGEIDIPAEDDVLFEKEFGTYLNTLHGDR